MNKTSQGHAAKKLLNGATISFIGVIFVTATSFILKAITARHIGSQGYGTLVIALSYVAVLSSLCSMAYNSSLSRQISFHEEDPHIIYHSIITSLATSLPISALLVFFIYYFSSSISIMIFDNIDNAHVIEIFSMLIIAYTIREILSGIFRGLHKIKSFILCIRILPNLLLVIFVSSAIYLDSKQTFIFIIYVTAICISIGIAAYIALTILLKKHLTGPLSLIQFKSSTSQLLSFTLPIWLSQCIGTFRGKLDIIFLGVYSTISAVGIYATALTLARLLATPMNMINNVYLPVLTQSYQSHGLEPLQGIYQSISKWQVLITTPLFLFLAYDGDVLIGGFFGDQFLNGQQILTILSIGIYINTISGSFGETLNAIGKPILNTYISLLSITTMLISCVFLIPLYGSLGAALSGTLSLISATLLGLFFLKTYAGAFPFNMGSIINFIILFIPFFFFHQLIEFSNAKHQLSIMLTSILLCYYISFNILRLFNRINSDEAKAVIAYTTKLHLSWLLPAVIWGDK